MLSHPSFSSPLINEDLPAGLKLVFTLNNRFFRHQACYSLLPARPGGQADRVISLYKYKVVGTVAVTQTREYIDWRWPLSCVHSIIMVFSAQLAEGGGSWPLLSFYCICPHHKSFIAPSTPLPSKTSELQQPVRKLIAPLPFSLVAVSRVGVQIAYSKCIQYMYRITVCSMHSNISQIYTLYSGDRKYLIM
jgi:hypothetical protein